MARSQLELSTFRLGRVQRSILRRGAMLLGISAPAFVINLSLYYVAARLLPPAQFGVLYLAITMSNVLFAPSVVISIYYSRHLVLLHNERGEHVTLHAVATLIAAVARAGALLSLATMGVLLLVRVWLGVQSIPVIVLVVLTTYAAYVADTARIAYQGLSRFFRLGIYFLSWCIARVGLCVVGLQLLERVWAGLVGIGVGVMAVFSVFYAGLRLRLRASERPADLKLPAPKLMLPVALGYGLFIGISYLDIFLGYLLLGQEALGRYSASSVLPKGLLVITMPVVQVLFPAIVGHGRDGGVGLRMLGKGALLTLATAGGAAAVIYLAADYVCAGQYGIKLCERLPMGAMLVAAVALCLVRVLVVAQFARGRDWHPLLLVFPTVAYAVIAATSPVDILDMAQQFAMFAVALLLFYGLCCLLDGRSWLRPRSLVERGAKNHG